MFIHRFPLWEHVRFYTLDSCKNPEHCTLTNTTRHVRHVRIRGGIRTYLLTAFVIIGHIPYSDFAYSKAIFMRI